MTTNRVIQPFERKSRSHRTIAHEHAKIHDEDAYTFSIQTSFSNAGSFTILLINPASSFPHFRTVAINPENGPIRARIYRAPVIDVNSLGTPVQVHNMDFNSANVSSMTVYVNPVTNVASLGTAIPDDILLPAPSVNGGAQLSPTTLEFILKQNENVLIRIDNQSGSNTQLTYKAYYYETRIE